MKNRFLSKRYCKDIATPMGKAMDLTYSFDDLINLCLGDPDLITDERIIDAAFADAKRGYTKYTDVRGDPELRAEIAKFYDEEYGMKVSDEEIFVTTSGCIAMHLIMEAILNDGDEVLIQAPLFTPYIQQVQLSRGVPVELPTYEEEDFQINIERLAAAITPKTKALILNSPSNPTGSCLSLETMQKIAEIVKKHDLVVVADDIYTAFSFQTPFVPFASLPGMREHTITINSFSKNFTMTGWRLGNIVADPEIVDTIRTINENVVFTAPSISQRGAIFALRNCKAIQPALIGEYRRRVYYAAERINGIRNMSVLYPPKGTFYVFPSIKATGLTSAQAADVILREAHVLTIPGNSFGKCGEGYLRMACTVGVDKLAEAFDRIEKMAVFGKR